MGWKQFLKEVDRSQRRKERAALVRHRELCRERAKLEKQHIKLAEQEDARAAVKEFDSYLDILTSLHKDCADQLDWVQIAKSRPPTKPAPSTARGDKARAALDNYQPSFLDKILFYVKKRLKNLEADWHVAMNQDQKENDVELKKYNEEFLNWEILYKLSEGVLQKNAETFKRALQYISPYQEIEEFNTKVVIDEAEADVVALSCYLNDEELIPNEELKLTTSGKLSNKAMPTGRYWSLYQDYVCSCAIRVARETLAALPIRRVIVNIITKRFDTATGHKGNATILAAHFTREAMSKINFELIDPSDSLKNFNFRMKFKKIGGFESVEPISIDEQWVSA